MMNLCDQQGSLEGSGGKSGPQEKGPGPAGTERNGPGTERIGTERNGTDRERTGTPDLDQPGGQGLSIRSII